MGVLSARLLAAGARAFATVPPAVSGKARRRPCRRALAILWRARQTRGPRRLRGASGAVARRRMGGLQQTPLRRPSGRAGLSVALHPPRLHLPTAACWPATATASRSNTRITASKDTRGKKSCGSRPTSSSAGSSSMSCQQAFTAFATTACSLAASAPKTSPARASCSPQRSHANKTSAPKDDDQPEPPRVLAHPCPCCGGRMIVIETFERGRASRGSSLDEIRIDSS